jgi:hypothetical protein
MICITALTICESPVAQSTAHVARLWCQWAGRDTCRHSGRRPKGGAPSLHLWVVTEEHEHGRSVNPVGRTSSSSPP